MIKALKEFFFGEKETYWEDRERREEYKDSGKNDPHEKRAYQASENRRKELERKLLAGEDVRIKASHRVNLLKRLEKHKRIY